MTVNSWVNAEGIVVGSGGYWGDSDRAPNRARALVTSGAFKQLEMDVDLALVADAATSFPADLDNDGTADGFTDHDACIPAQAQIIRCIFVSSETAAGGTNVDIGTYEKDGTAIDADGLFVDLLTAEMALGEVSHGDGAEVEASGIGVTRASSDKDAYIAFTPNGTFTAGKGRLIIEYLDPIADA